MKSIRPARSEDAGLIAALHIAGWRDSYHDVLDPDFLLGPFEEERAGHWHARLRSCDHKTAVFVMDDGGELTGFICVKAQDDPVWGAYIDSLHVSQGARGDGAGRALLRAAAR